MVLAAGDVFAGYTIEAVLGTGGMGAVYLAKHPRLPRRDALKLLNPAFSSDPGFRARFEREADLASGLIHRNIVAVYDRGAVDGQLWISMQHVAGVDASVAARSGDGSMTPHRVVHIVTEVGAGLDFAHRAGLLHRDVKPANILLAPSDDPAEPEHVLLTDFGIAKSTDEVQHLTGTGNLLATLAYASPEQIEAGQLDHRVDIYALGCVLYELLTGSVPFPESSPFATMTAHLKNPPPKPSDTVPWLPPGFDAVVAKAMAKKPEDRYNTCRELSLAARAALAAADPAASTPTRAEMSVPVAATPARGGDHTSVEPPASGADAAAKAAAEAAAAVEAIALTTPRPPYTVSVRRTSPSQGTVSELGPVSTNYLSANSRIELEELLHRVRFFDLPPRLPLIEIVPGDVLQEITVGNKDVTRTVVYEREGAKRPKELDDIVTMLERLAGWQTIRQSQVLPRSGVAGWTPTGTVSPLGANAYRSTESIPPATYVGAPAGPGGGFYGTGPSPTHGNTGPQRPGGPPSGGPPPGGQYHSGPHPTGYPQQFAAAPTGSSPAAQKSGGGMRKWILIGLAAVLVIAGGVTAALLLNRSEPVAQGPSTPANLTAIADGRDVTVAWDATTGATGYTLSRGDKVVYTGVAPRYSDPKVVPGTYTYTVTASNAAGKQSAASAPVLVTVTDPWGPAAIAVDEFPDLLPATPADKGFGDATCSIASDTEKSNADAIVSCTDPQDVYFEVMHFPSVEDKDAYLKRDWANSPKIVNWNIDGVDQGELYRSADDEASFPYIITTFNDPKRSQFLLYVHWKDHTMKDLQDNWWGPATF